jgi:[glutamine synthetase] adenylyltransferase / [glutamine synthetase]-adenylyl-L-tyrosine phosphorylase
VLARLAEKGYITEQERARLSAAYTFLRTVEHRLQMEHGAQKHALPVARERLRLVARRCGYTDASDANDAVAQFNRDLEAHTSSVRAIYNRVFAESRPSQNASTAGSEIESRGIEGGTFEKEIDDETGRLIKQAVAALRRVILILTEADSEKAKRAIEDDAIEQSITSALAFAINPLRSLRNAVAWAESLATYTLDNIHATGWSVLADNWPRLIRRLLPTLSSQYLSHVLVSRPALAAVLVNETAHDESDFYQVMRRAIAEESNPASKTDALRRTWYRLIVEIGYKDMIGAGRGREGEKVKRLKGEKGEGEKGEQAAESEDKVISQPFPPFPLPSLTPTWRLNNLEQTALAEAALRVAFEIACESVGVAQTETLPFAILGLGRFGHSGMDYGSDLDLLMVFDDAAAWPLSQSASPQEFYAKLASELVHTLSSITREGLLYRIDLRLRPDGKSGQLAQGMNGLLSYLANRASAWEHSAYLKAREVAGDMQLGARVRLAICDAGFDAASRNESLKEDLAGVRERLEKEKARRGRPDIKWGGGGMTDVYFITRYLQLRDRIYFAPGHGTTALILHLGERGSLDSESTRALYEGYFFLRRLDHWMRLLLDRPTPVLPTSQVALGDLARALGLTSTEEFERQFAHHTAAIRSVYDRVF